MPLEVARNVDFGGTPTRVDGSVATYTLDLAAGGQVDIVYSGELRVIADDVATVEGFVDAWEAAFADLHPLDPRPEGEATIEQV
ncbi:MAG: hypothetical protein ACRD0G_06270 [Acidimicrobiales bacterium]